MHIHIPVKGNRTIASVVLYIAYQVSVNHGWMQPIPELDLALKAAIVIFFKKGLEGTVKETCQAPIKEVKPNVA